MNQPDVPRLSGYFNTPASMDAEQLRFFKKVHAALAKGDYISVDGQVGYVYAFLYGYLAAWKKTGFESLSAFLVHVSELYVQEPKLSEACLHWAADCLLGRDQFSEYLETTAPKTVTKTYGHKSNLRLNIQRHLGLAADPVDIVTTLKARKNKVISEHEGPYRTLLHEVFAEHAVREGDWYEFLLRDNYGKGVKYAHSLFQGSPISVNPKLSVMLDSFYSTHEGVKAVEALTRETENRLRAKLKLPLIGEGWVSETRLFRALEGAFPQTIVIQHGTPRWLGRQHLDVWFPHWNVAVEYHGAQHFRPVEFFGGQEAFEETIKRDQRKQDLCRVNNVKLFVVTEDDSHETVIKMVREHAEQTRMRVQAPTV